jgi:hypothetical protein
MMVSVRRVAPVLLLVMTLPAFAKATPKSSTHPPRELHRVGDHWTAYNPPDPSTYSPTAKTYTIKRGDTLWALANTFYSNPYLWPQLWESNTWITDAHWIYPGDVLLVEGESAAGAASTTSGATNTTLSGSMERTAEDTSGGIPVANIATPSTPVALAAEADLYCYGYIGDPNESMPNRIASFEDVEVTYHPGVVEQTDHVSMGDLIYVTGGTSTGIVPGETYLVVEPGDLIKHPRTGATIGRRYDYRGQIRILCGDETTSRAIVVQSCREIARGARLKPMPQLPIPIARIPEIPTICDTPTGHTNGTILSADGFIYNLGVGNLVHIDLGREDQIQPGDFLTVYRESPLAGQPRTILGELGVLTTESHTATARVVASRRSMTIGDKIEAR